MIKSLTLKNVFLFKDQKIFFDKGLNVLTGETGSGKTTIISSIEIILGSKALESVIKKDSTTGVIEAEFEIENKTNIISFLKENGYEIENNQLILRREILRNGKNRTFINDQLASLTILKELGNMLIEMVSQNSCLELFSPSYQQNLLDTYSNITDQVENFSKLFTESKNLNKSLEKLIYLKEENNALLSQYKTDLNKLNEINLKPNEEESLTNEYNILINANEIYEKVDSILKSLKDNDNNIETVFYNFSNTLEKLSQIDPKLKESQQHIKNAIIEIEEATYLLNSYKSSLNCDPNRLEEIDTRLLQIHNLKKRFKDESLDIQKHKNILEEKIKTIEKIEDDIIEIRSKLDNTNLKLDNLAKKISEKRIYTALLFEKKIEDNLRLLNMPNASFKIKISPSTRSSSGDNLVEFYFSANIGEKVLPLKQCVSGGELARILLVIKTLLSHQDNTPCIIFDEIDANIGGHTATLVAEKLDLLSNSKQIICITHFIQVAKASKNHFKITKKEENNKAITIIEKLSQKAKEGEFQRMIGIKF